MCHQHRYQHEIQEKTCCPKTSEDFLTKHSSKLNTHEQKRNKLKEYGVTRTLEFLFMPAVASSFTSSQIPS